MQVSQQHHLATQPGSPDSLTAVRIFCSIIYTCTPGPPPHTHTNNKHAQLTHKQVLLVRHFLSFPVHHKEKEGKQNKDLVIEQGWPAVLVT